MACMGADGSGSVKIPSTSILKWKCEKAEKGGYQTGFT